MATRTNIAKFFVFIVALQLLNLSVYTQSFRLPGESNTIGGINIIDNVAEFIAETVLHYENAFPEYPEKRQHKDLHIHKNLTIQLFNEVQQPLITQTFSVLNNNPDFFYKQYSYMFFKEINPPPPKA